LKLILIILFASIYGSYASAQNCSLTLAGHVEDTDTKERLHAATVFLKEINKQIVTDSKGDFIFENLCEGQYTIEVSHVNCETVQKKIQLTKNSHVDIFLPHEKNTLTEVTVEAAKGIANTGFKKELSGKALQETRGLSLSEALSRINGVTMLQTGSTISKPIIHGLHSNRILTINNGVRQEGQQWGNEHAPEIDPFIADKLTVIKGVDELKYGSDAIGGVILIDPKPLRNKPGYAAEINTAYFTNNHQYVASGVFEQQFKKYPAFTYRIQGTFKKAANTTTPGYRLNNTASEEKNFSLTAGFKKEKFNTELFYSQFATRLGIFTGSHIGNLTDLENAIAAPKPDDVFLGKNSYEIKRPSQEVAHHLIKSKSLLRVGEHKFNVLLSSQYNRRKEFDIVTSSTNTKPQMDLSMITFTEDVAWEHPKKFNLNGTVGLSAMQQDNAYGGRYFIPNYRSYTFGGYLIEKWSKQKWELQAGIRYDNKNINTTRLKFGGDTINYDFHFSTWASSLNTVYKLNGNWQMNVNIALASRAPHVNELLSNGIHHGTATYEEGDIFLKPEQAVNIAAGTSYHNDANTFSFDVNIYNNSINNFIYQQPLPDEPVLTIAGAFPKIQYRQTNAVLRGIDVSTTVSIAKPLQWNARLSILRATNKKINEWLILMPADRFSNELSYTFKESHLFHDSYVSAELQNVFRQTRVPSDKYGKQDYKVPPGGYAILNMNASATIHLKELPLTFSIGVRNLLNKIYRDYLNSFRYFTDEMGRNINFRIKIPITHNN
jgi:iron complex outermembrane receptor protein